MSTRGASDKQEKRIAHKFNGKVVPNSGGTKFQGGDVVTDNFLIEAKTCLQSKNSMSIKKDWLIKMQEQAFEQGKSYSALAIDFGENADYFIINSKLFKFLLEVLDKEC